MGCHFCYQELLVLVSAGTAAHYVWCRGRLALKARWRAARKENNGN